MGWESFIFDNELLQRVDIERTRRAMQAQTFVNAKARGRMRRNVEALEEDLGMLALACRTMMRLLIEKGVLTRDEIAAVMKAIDGQDGAVDGRWSGPVDAP
jgi:hypothetical protein